MIYIGVHKTNNIDDGYMGSGTYLKRAIRKYGLENFSKEVLAIFDNPIEMFQMEKMLVNEEFVSNTNTYNTKLGGSGGWDFINGREELRIAKNKKARLAADDKIKSVYGVDNPSKIDHVRVQSSERLRQRHRNGEFVGQYAKFSGKNHTPETKRKIGKANSIHQLGKGNSQYGTIWITNGTCSKKIKADSDIPDGWWRGRK